MTRSLSARQAVVRATGRLLHLVSEQAPVSGRRRRRSLPLRNRGAVAPPPLELAIARDEQRQLAARVGAPSMCGHGATSVDDPARPHLSTGRSRRQGPWRRAWANLGAPRSYCWHDRIRVSRRHGADECNGDQALVPIRHQTADSGLLLAPRFERSGPARRLAPDRSWRTLRDLCFSSGRPAQLTCANA